MKWLPMALMVIFIALNAACSGGAEAGDDGPPDPGKASGLDARIVVPSAAVRQAASSHELYVVPGSNSRDVLAFYQRALPAMGWKIDAKTSDFEGKTPGTGGTRIVNVCMAPAVWRSVLIADGTNGAELIVMAPPDTDPCR